MPDVRGSFDAPGNDLSYFWRQQRKATAIFVEALPISKEHKNRLASINTLDRRRGNWQDLDHDKQTECYYMLRSLFGKHRSDNEVSQCIKQQVREISAAALLGGEWSGENAIQRIEKAIERAFAAGFRTKVKLATALTQTRFQTSVFPRSLSNPRGWCSKKQRKYLAFYQFACSYFCPWQSCLSSEEP